MTFRWPWVSRRAFDFAIERFEKEQRENAALRLDCARQIAFAFEQSNKSIEQATRDARAAMTQAVEMSKIASKALFGGVTDEPASASSRSANDREETIRRRNQEMGRR